MRLTMKMYKKIQTKQYKTSPILTSFTTSFGHQPVIRTPIVPRLEAQKIWTQYSILDSEPVFDVFG